METYVRKHAQEFLDLKNKELDLIRATNLVLGNFSRSPGKSAYHQAHARVLDTKDSLKHAHARLAQIVETYASASEQERHLFMKTYYEGCGAPDGRGRYEPKTSRGRYGAPFDCNRLVSMFDALLVHTVPLSEEQEAQVNQDNLQACQRYRAYVLQSMGDAIGLNQTASLLNHLNGQRMIHVTVGSRFDMSAGPLNGNELPYGTKLRGDGDTNTRQSLYDDSGGSLFQALKSGYDRQQGKGPLSARKPNLMASGLKDMQINLDKASELFALFVGRLPDGNAALFSAPKYLAVHHEHGHLISLLKGKYGPKSSYSLAATPFATLTDEEEENNIFGSRRSDRFYCELLGLPVRFSHQLIVSRIDDEPNEEEQVDWTRQLDTATMFSNTPDEALLLLIESITSLDWSIQTSGPSISMGWVNINKAPKGVKEVQSLAREKGKSARDILLEMCKLAEERSRKPSDKRSALTTEFYELLTDCPPKTEERRGQIVTALRLLRHKLLSVT